jgi:hypothetical protein
MGYGRSYGRRGYSRPQTAGRVARPNARPGTCRDCGEEVPAGAGQLWREGSGAWSVVHVPAEQGGWVMDPQPYRGGCPESTDKRNAELHASGFFGAGAAAPVSERERIAAVAARYAAANPVAAQHGTYRGGKYAYTSSGARMTNRYRRCEDAPCCGCCD